jgi:anti-sigma factor RsiW
MTQNMSQHLSAQDFERYRNRDLSPAEILALGDHLENCVSCQAEGRENKEIQNATKQILSQLQAETDFPETHLGYQAVADYVDNTLSEVEREIADSHLEHCRSCEEEVDDLLATKAQLALLPDASYLPRKIPNLWQRLTGLWQLPSIGIPAQAGAVIILVALIAWAVISYSRKHAEEARLRSGQQDSAVAVNSSPVNSEATATNQSSQEPESNPRLAVELIDGDHRVTLTSEGNLLGLESASAQTQNEVISALKSGRVGSPSFMAELKGHSGRLMGAASSDYGLLNPIATAVESRTPTFRWRAIDGAESYIVTIYDLDSKKIEGSGPLAETKWKASAPLERGRVYTWQVRASKHGQEVLLPPPAAPEAKFKIIDAAKAQELAQERRREARSHLMLGLAYANAGLLDDSVRELRKLVVANPKSSVARSLLRSAVAQQGSR